ncbi:hypothetical protein R3P38DRAFT_3201713 [Favolaschia claudopus]|uniref:Uncharacterized protein n=1 Tax=Favolaschia claudopus TaxID=2862362 RepID=A0AAW0AX48_9AGAR
MRDKNNLFARALKSQHLQGLTAYERAPLSGAVKIPDTVNPTNRLHRRPIAFLVVPLPAIPTTPFSFSLLITNFAGLDPYTPLPPPPLKTDRVPPSVDAAPEIGLRCR